jgi:hypothetical protein
VCGTKENEGIIMTNPNKTYSPAKYRIKFKERIDRNGSNWFEEMVISIECGMTILTGHVPDQAAFSRQTRPADNTLWNTIS